MNLTGLRLFLMRTLRACRSGTRMNSSFECGKLHNHRRVTDIERAAKEHVDVEVLELSRYLHRCAKLRMLNRLR